MVMAEGGIRKSERLKAISVRFIEDSDVKNLIQPIIRSDKGKIKSSKSSDNSNSYSKLYKKRSGITKIDEEPAKSSKVTPAKNKQSRYIDDLSSEDDDDDEVTLERYEKPTALFEDSDVSGKQMFGFQTPKRKGAMAVKASESASKATPTQKKEIVENITPKVKKSSTPVTPRSNRTIRSARKDDRAVLNTAKTPYILRKNIKRRISVEKLKEASGLSSGDDSDYKVSTDSDSDESEKSSDSSTEEKVQKTTPRRSLFNQATPASSANTRQKKKDLNYVFTSDVYFETHATKVKTSDHTLSRLRTPRLNHDTMNALLKDIPHSHESSVRTLVEDHMRRFRRWLFSLSQGYSILVYGLGSKRNLLNSFHKEMIDNSLVLVVNGFFPSLTIKEVVDGIAGDLLDLKNLPPQPLSVVSGIESKLNHSKKRVFLIVHNLDGPMLRSDKAQGILARLASIRRLHLIASVDHINCPLLWDHNKLSNYNFVWEDATSFLPYTEETSFETSLMVQRSGSLALASLTNVFQSLTKNAREIFKLLLEDHLSNKTNQKYIGMALSELYRQSRDAMLVTSDLALRTQLTEFLDHQLVKWRRDSDHLYIPIDTAILKQFQKDLEEKEL